MLPKSSKHYIQPTADKLKLDYELVEDIVTYYYEKLRKALTDLSYPVIRVENLGTFKASDKKLKELYMRYKKHTEISSTDTIRQMAVKKRAEDKLAKVINIQDYIMEEKRRKKEFYKRKNNGEFK
jgi:hypothetical protein